MDWSGVPEESLAQFQSVPGLDMAKLNLSLYYGVTGDNVFVLGLYPNLEDVYGKGGLEKDGSFSDHALSSWEKKPAGVFMFKTEGLMNISDKYLGMFGLALPPEQIELAKSVTKFIRTFEYSVETENVADGILHGNTFVKVTKIEEE